MKPRDPAARASRPDHDVHLTGNVMVLMRRRVVADNTVFHERGRGSWVVLPGV